MQCLRFWFTIWLFAISVNNSVASPVDILIVDNKNVSDLNIAESNQDDAVVSERDNEVGYLRKEDEKGADAYQHFESFHDKDGDAYGYEKHEAYGKSNKDESLNDEKDKAEGNHYNYVQELGDKAKYQKYQGSIDDPGKNKQSNYHYSYKSDDDDDEDEAKPHFSSNYKEQDKQDNSDEDDDEEEKENDIGTEDDGTDEEKSTNFSYKIISDDYAEEDGNDDVSAKDNGNGFHFGHGDRNTNVDYNIKRSDYIIGDTQNEDDDEDDSDDDGDEDDGGEDDSSGEEDEINVIGKNQKINENDGKDKNAKSYNTYTVFSSQEGDDEDENNDSDKNHKTVPKHAVRYENANQIKDNRKPNRQKIEEEDNVHNGGHVKDDVELHQPPLPRPTKPVVLVKEHRTSYQVAKDIPKSKQSKSPVIIQPLQPIVNVQQHHAGYKVEESDGGKGTGDSGKDSGDSGKGHGGSVTKHLYEIYVTHNTEKSNGGGGDSKEADDGADDSGKSANLVLAQPPTSNIKADGNENGTYKVNIKYGNKKGLKKKVYRKRKGNLKTKKIITPHKYEVEEEYVENEEEKKQPVVAGKASSPPHHRDSEDYSEGQQFVYASEADSDAYYW